MRDRPEPRTFHRFEDTDTPRYIQHALQTTGTTVIVDDADGWPSGDYHAVIEPGTHREEVVKVVRRKDNMLLVNRGFTTDAYPHPAGSSIQQVLYREFTESMPATSSPQWSGLSTTPSSQMHPPSAPGAGPNWDHWAGPGPLAPGSTGSPLKFMPPGHFCPDVCGIEDFGEADYLRGRVVRAFFRLMQFWPKPTPKTRRRTRANR